MNDLDQELLAHGTWATLSPLVHAVSRATCALPHASLLPGERQILGGSLFPGGGHFVELVAAALTEHAALFPDLDTDSAALLEAQNTAFLWASLRNHFQHLAERAADTCVKLQALSIRQALAVVEHVRTLSALPASQRAAGRFHAERIEALTPALLVLGTYRRSIVQIRKKKEKARRPAVAVAHAHAAAPVHGAGVAPPHVQATAWPPPHVQATAWPPPHAQTTAWPPPHVQATAWPPPHAHATAWPPPPAHARRTAPRPSPQKRLAIAEAKVRNRARLFADFRAHVRTGGPPVTSSAHAPPPPS